MPPKTRITKDDIVLAGLALVRESGEDGLNARAVAARLGCSTQPIFSNYPTMGELKKSVIARAAEEFAAYTAKAMQETAMPPYKTVGMAYIRFAREQRQLFRLLFMRDRTGETIMEDRQSLADILRVIREHTGLTEDEAYSFHIEMWIWVHGVASMHATGYLDLPEETVSAMLTDVFRGLCARYANREE